MSQAKSFFTQPREGAGRHHASWARRAESFKRVLRGITHELCFWSFFFTHDWTLWQWNPCTGRAQGAQGLGGSTALTVSNSRGQASRAIWGHFVSPDYSPHTRAASRQMSLLLTPGLVGEGAEPAQVGSHTACHTLNHTSLILHPLRSQLAPQVKAKELWGLLPLPPRTHGWPF